jgi:hypothetical protein
MTDKEFEKLLDEESASESDDGDRKKKKKRKRRESVCLKRNLVFSDIVLSKLVYKVLSSNLFLNQNLLVVSAGFTA